MSIEGHEQTNILLFNCRIRHFAWRPEDLHMFYCCQRHKLAIKHCCATFNVFIQLTVTCSSTRHTECSVAFPLQQWLWERVICTLPILFHVKICLSVSLAVFNFSAVILMPKWWSHQSQYLFHILVSFHCYQTARSSGAAHGFLLFNSHTLWL